ncbi:MAG TPA: hypothetical protein VKA73_07770 [Rubrobacter sp.]|nr:hypothetical protein [Rubrobacter sp.]
MFAALIFLLLLCAACGGGGEEASVPEEDAETPPPVESAPPVQPGVPVGRGQAETISDPSFTLNTAQPVPPNFSEAYGRRARIAVQFYKLDEDALDYPQGLSVDRQMRDAMDELRVQYPTIEFFSYDIDNPGAAAGNGELQEGEYGTLAAQLGVGITPFVAMLAPTSGGEYVITNLFQGYTPQAVLSQALFDLAAVEVEDNTSDVDVVIETVDVTDDGGGIEFFSVQNRTEKSVNLQGYTLRVLSPEDAQVDPDAPQVTISSDVRIPPQGSASVGRVPDVVDADGDRVSGTFEGGTNLDLAPGDQVALLDPGGAVASTWTV